MVGLANDFSKFNVDPVPDLDDGQSGGVLPTDVQTTITEKDTDEKNSDDDYGSSEGSSDELAGGRERSNSLESKVKRPSVAMMQAYPPMPGKAVHGSSTTHTSTPPANILGNISAQTTTGGTHT